MCRDRRPSVVSCSPSLVGCPQLRLRVRYGGQRGAVWNPERVATLLHVRDSCLRLCMHSYGQMAGDSDAPNAVHIVRSIGQHVCPEHQELRCDNRSTRSKDGCGSSNVSHERLGVEVICRKWCVLHRGRRQPSLVSRIRTSASSVDATC